MNLNNDQGVSRLLAKDAIRDLVLQYSVAVADRDLELMVSLFTKDADFGSWGKGPEALKNLMGSTMGDMELGIILVTNHLIEFVDDDLAGGEVWAKCFAQSSSEGYYEQLVKYVDVYRRITDLPKGREMWKFEKRKHLLWFGEGRESPLMQDPAYWPQNNVGIGRIPLSDDAVKKFRQKYS